MGGRSHYLISSRLSSAAIWSGWTLPSRRSRTFPQFSFPLWDVTYSARVTMQTWSIRFKYSRSTGFPWIPRNLPCECLLRIWPSGSRVNRKRPIRTQASCLGNCCMLPCTGSSDSKSQCANSLWNICLFELGIRYCICWFNLAFKKSRLAHEANNQALRHPWTP